MRYIRLKKANQKPKNGIEMKSKLFSTGYKNVFRRVVRKELDLKNIYIFKSDFFVKNIDRGANNFIQNNTDNLFEPTKTRPRKTFEFKLIESKDAFQFGTSSDFSDKKRVLGVIYLNFLNTSFVISEK